MDQLLQSLSLAISSPMERRRLYERLVIRAWPLLRRVAELHRRTLSSRSRVVVVVGSFGKTTTTAAVSAALGLPEPSARDNAFSHIALALLRILPGQRHATIEIGIGGRGQMILYAQMVKPDVVVVTAVGSEHHRSLGTLAETRDEKAQILRGLRAGGVAVLNGDDPHVRAMAGLTDARVLTFGFGADNDVRASEMHLDWPHGTRLRVHIGSEVRDLRVRLLGRVLMYPVLATLAVALAEGRPLDRVAAALEALPPRPGRMQPVPLANGAWLIRDDFKSTGETIDAALDTLAEVPARRIVVLGDVSEPVGSSGPHYRRVGERLAAVASRVVVVGSGHRRYAAGAVRAGMARTALVKAGRSVREAARLAQAELEPGDVVLIKGRGTQRLDRVALALQGRMVGCEIEFCNLQTTRCETCAILERRSGSYKDTRRDSVVGRLSSPISARDSRTLTAAEDGTR